VISADILTMVRNLALRRMELAEMVDPTFVLRSRRGNVKEVMDADSPMKTETMDGEVGMAVTTTIAAQNLLFVLHSKRVNVKEEVAADLATKMNLEVIEVLFPTSPLTARQEHVMHSNEVNVTEAIVVDLATALEEQLEATLALLVCVTNFRKVNAKEATVADIHTIPMPKTMDLHLQDLKCALRFKKVNVTGEMLADTLMRLRDISFLVFSVWFTLSESLRWIILPASV